MSELDPKDLVRALNELADLPTRQHTPRPSGGRVSDMETIGGDGCWCGGAKNHGWPGKADGEPHPRSEESIHGTSAGTYYHHRRGEPACAKCRAHHAALQARIRAERKTRLDAGEDLPVPHGTLGGHTNWGCNCVYCRQAQAANQKKKRLERRARLIANPNIVDHGKASTYINWMCRCEPCREANRAKAREMRERRNKA